MAPTNFEGYSHEQLLAMIASVSPETVKARATQLTEAAAVIEEIGGSLKKHRVKGWEGEAAHAFHDWVSRAGSATLLLADYSAAGGRWMTQAAQTMIEVKANTPAYDTVAAENLASAHQFHNDPDAQQLGRTAHAKLTTDHQHAVQQLTKLAQSYEQASAEMNKATVPTFPPPPPDFEPGDTRYGGSYIDRPSGAGSEGYTANPVDGAEVSGPSYRSESTTSGVQRDRFPHSTVGPVPSPAVLGPGVDVGLDHVVTLPDRTRPAPVGLPSGPEPSGPGGSSPLGPVPPLMLPPVGGTLPVTKPPVGIGDKAGGLPLLAPRDTGIVGGRPIAAGTSGAGIPRGTVIGADAPTAGGRAMPGVMGGGFGGPHGSPGSIATGRRLAAEPGGVVGGRPAAGGSQPFTQGGSGLVRGGGVGAMGHGGSASPALSRRRGGQTGERPDYLAEDEETWQGNRRVVPPVID